MRYQDNKPVDEVLAWLKEKQVTIARRNFHVFIERILRRLPLADAKRIGLNTELLIAVRVRHKLPRDPKKVVRLATGRKLVRHDSRSRHRPLISIRKPKPPQQPVARQPRPEAFQADQQPLPGIVAAPPDPQTPKMTGTMEKPEGYKDWKIVYLLARKKIGAINRTVFFVKGRVFNNRTKEEYTPEDLVHIFHLTPIEAQSCYMTFTQ